MPRSSFNRAMDVTADRERCWSTLTDVPQLVSWVSVLEDASEVVPLDSYTAVLADRLGPFKLRADLDIKLSDVRPGEHVVVRAEGEDRQVGSRIVVDAVLDIRSGEGDDHTIAVDGTYEVTGRVASMGTGTIRKKADKILDEFFSHVSSALGGR